MSRRHGVMRIGRMARWQRRCTYALFGTCFVSGIVWFALMDLGGWQPPQLVFWWIVHGVSSFVALLAIGAAIPQHVVATWRHHRNRLAGTTSFAFIALAALSALLLLYGPEASRAAVHWAHVGIGLGLVVAFAWHVLRGRRSLSTITPVASATTAAAPPGIALKAAAVSAENTKA